MRSGGRVAAVLAIGACLMVAPAIAAPKLGSILVKDLSFGAAPAGLRVGDTVRWVNRDVFRHSATAAGVFDVDLKPGSSGELVLKRAGVYNYICRYHPGMKGQIRVAP